MGAALIDVFDHTIDGVHLTGEQGRDELHRVVGFEKGSLKGDKGISGAMGLVEPVTTELFHQIEKGLGFIFFVAIFHSPLYEALTVLSHHGSNLLPHRLAKTVCFSHGITGQSAGDLHHLFLIDDDTVGIFQDRLQIGDHVGHFFAAVLALHKIVHHAAVQRAGPVEGHQGSDFVEVLRPEPHQQIFHPGAFQLEHAGCVACGQQFVSIRIRKIHGRQIKGRLALLLDQLQGIVDHRQVAKTKKVELDQSDPFHQLHIKLGDNFTLFPFVEGKVFDQWLVADHHSRSMG